MRRWISKTIVVLIFVGLIAGGAAWYTRRDDKPAASFRTVALKRGDLLATISATGTVEPEEVIDVGAQVAGQINTFGKDKNGKPVDYGSEVEEGTILAQIDQSLYNADVATAKAQLAQSLATVKRDEANLLQLQAKLDQAQRDWDRAQKLGPSDALAQATYDGYKSTFDAAKADISVGEATITQSRSMIDAAQATVDRAMRNLGYTTIKSPVNGVIIDRRVNIGQTVVSSLNAPSLFLIAKDLKRMQVWASVNEADIGNIRAGQTADFTVDAFPGRTFHGTVGKVRLNATMTQNVVTYTVEIIADNSDGKLLPYLTANVQFEVDRRENVLLVPNIALRWTPSSPDQMTPESRSATEDRAPAADSAPASQPSRGDKKSGGAAHHRGTVWVTEGNLVKPIRVKIGLTDGTNTEVTSDELAEGAQVVTGEARAADAGTGDAKNPFMPQFPNRRQTSGSGGASGSSSGSGSGGNRAR